MLPALVGDCPHCLMLELVFQGKLNLPVVCRRAGDAGSSWLIYSAPGQAEVGMVQHIEELRAELNLVSFMQLEALLQNKIHIDEIGAAQIADPRVTEDMRDLLPRRQRWCDEYRLVIPTRQRLVTGMIATEIRLQGLPN